MCRGGAGARRRRWPVRRGCEAGRGRHRGRRARWPSSGREERAGGCWDRTRRFRVGLRKTAQVLSRAAISSSVSIGTGFSGGAGTSMPSVGRDLQLSFSHQPSAEPGASRAGACRRWRGREGAKGRVPSQLGATGGCRDSRQAAAADVGAVGAAEIGHVRDDVAPDELAGYCLRAVSAREGERTRPDAAPRGRPTPPTSQVGRLR